MQVKLKFDSELKTNVTPWSGDIHSIKKKTLKFSPRVIHVLINGFPIKVMLFMDKSFKDGNDLVPRVLSLS